MSGIYIHIPFCKKRCHYCDFYSQTSLQQRSGCIDALVKEIQLRKTYLPANQVQTIYFGGGTPSLLSREEFEKILGAVYSTCQVDAGAELTFEANPDDLTEEYLASLESLPFNRISIGIQSFDDDDLKTLNRRHTARQAIRAIQAAQEYGFGNISIDLIYGLPGQTLGAWEKQLDTALQCGVQHISAYGLTYEEGTMLSRLRDENKLQAAGDELMVAMYRMLLEKVQAQGYEAYEISNFALPGFRSRHNSSYWKQVPYLGIGPSAHSYNGVSRQWNVASLSAYIQGIAAGQPGVEIENLSADDQYNDFVLVSLRTSDGLNISELETKFGKEMSRYCLQNIKTFIESEKVNQENGVLRLTTEGILISDLILTQLMKV